MNSPFSDKYINVVNQFDSTVEQALKMNRKFEGVEGLPFFQYFSTILFTSLCTRTISLSYLIPASRITAKSPVNWDYSSVAAITRSVLETRLAFFYLCIDKCSNAERESRWNVFQLHDSCSRERLFGAFSDGDEQMEAFQVQSEEIRERLKSNSHFSGLKKSTMKKLLNGKSAYAESLEDIAIRMDIPLNEFRIYYQLLSSFTHSFPISFLRMGDQIRGRGIHSQVEEGYIIMFLELVIHQLEAAANEFAVQFD